MAQFARPDSTVTATGFTGGFADIDEVTASDADFAVTPDNTTGQLEVGLSDVTDPVASTGHVLRYRLAKADTGVPPSTTGNTQTGTVSLYQGATLIAADVERTLGAWTDYSLTLSGAQADAITDYTDLRIRFDSPASGGGPGGNRRGGAISWAELEVPDFVAPGPSPAPMALTVAAPAPARLDLTVAPAPIAIALSPLAPSIPLIVEADAIALALATVAHERMDVTLDPAAIAVSVALVAPDRMDLHPTPGAIALSMATPAANVAAVVTTDPVALAIAAADGRVDLETTTGAIALTVTPQAPVRLDFEVATDAQGVTLTPIAPSRTDQEATLDAITITLALPSPIVNLAGSDTISPDALALTLAAAVPQADLDAAVGALGLAMVAPSPQRVDQAVLPEPVVLTITALLPSVDQAIAPATLTILVEAPAPVEVEHRLLAEVIAIALGVVAPELTNEGGAITARGIRARSVRVVLPAGLWMAGNTTRSE